MRRRAFVKRIFSAPAQRGRGTTRSVVEGAPASTQIDSVQKHRSLLFVRFYPPPRSGGGGRRRRVRPEVAGPMTGSAWWRGRRPRRKSDSVKKPRSLIVWLLAIPLFASSAQRPPPPRKRAVPLPRCAGADSALRCVAWIAQAQSSAHPITLICDHRNGDVALDIVPIIVTYSPQPRSRKRTSAGDPG